MSEESESDELNESELIELPFFLRALFDWLLDHHAVSCAEEKLNFELCTALVITEVVP